jgi:hypothetical protein
MVEIASNKPVYALKNAIKDARKVAFQHIDSHDLNLWEVSIPINDSLGDNVKKIKLGDKKPLSPADTLFEVFSVRPKRRHLHIIVQSPPISECKSLVVDVYLSAARNTT